MRQKKMISSGGFRLLPLHHEVQQLTSGWSGHCGGAWAPASRLPHVGRRRIELGRRAVINLSKIPQEHLNFRKTERTNGRCSTELPL